MARNFRRVQPFRYMEWAKRQSLAQFRFNLGSSGLAPPSAELLPLGELVPDLQQRGRHMPPDARRQLADHVGVGPDELMLTLGTSHAIYLLCASHLQPGDLCLVERPAYEMLCTVPTLFGARVARFERSFAEGWRLPVDLAERVRETKPALVLLSNPHNPTGVLVGKDDLAPVAAAAADVGALVVVDEVYLEYLPKPSSHSAASLGPHVVVASSFTKAFGLGAVRFGWLCGAAPVVEAALTYNDYISVLYPNPSAWVGLAALRRMAALKERAMRIAEEHRAIVDRFIEAQPTLRWSRPHAGVIGFVELPVDDATSFCERLAAERQTLLVPGEFFEAARFVRLGFGGERESLLAGLAHFAAALAEGGS